MSLPNNDREGRFRNKTIGFRVSDDEYEQISSLVALSDMTKQDYMISRVLGTEIHVTPTIRVQKTMTAELRRIASELERLSDASEVGLRLLEVSETVERMLGEMLEHGMTASQGEGRLREIEEADLRMVLPMDQRQVPVDPEKVTPAKRRRKVPKGFFGG